MMRTIKQVMNHSQKEMSRLNDEYEKMSSENKTKSALIQSSISTKSSELNKRKEARAKHFSFIRNK